MVCVDVGDEALEEDTAGPERKTPENIMTDQTLMIS